MSCWSLCCADASTGKDGDVLMSPQGPTKVGLSEDELAPAAVAVDAPLQASASPTSVKESAPQLDSAKQSPPKEEIPEVVPHELTLEIHSAALDRSFAKFGWMDPYAIILADGKEVERTKPATGAHKSPHWDVAHNFSAGHIPQHITIQVWDKNNFHKDVFCGGASMPCAEDMGSLAQQKLTLTKKDLPTGMLTISISAKEVRPAGSPKNAASSSFRPELIRSKSLGGEFDHLMAMVTPQDGAAAPKSADNASLTLIEVHHPEGEAAPAVASTSPPAAPANRSKSAEGVGAMSSIATHLAGSWRCVETFGLEEFLKATGVGMFQRKIAMAAAWPKWDFTVDGDILKFINHSAIGDLFEDIPLNKEYLWKDGHKNEMKCTASWQATPDGGCLTISRSGAIANYSEERAVSGNQLKFLLKHSSGVTWGRTFERAA